MAQADNCSSLLYIEDDALQRQVLADALRAAGFEVREAASGREGMLLMQEEPAKLVVTDIIMPDQEGLETIKQLGTFYPQTPVIAVSAGIPGFKFDVLRMARLLGAKRTFAKPVVMEELIAAIHELLGD